MFCSLYCLTYTTVPLRLQTFFRVSEKIHQLPKPVEDRSNQVLVGQQLVYHVTK